MYECKILADSNSPDGYHLTTFQITFPRFILAEFNTHRVFSRNSASSRAIPIKKRMARATFRPAAFGANQRGMQAGEELDKQLACKEIWESARESAIEHARRLGKENRRAQAMGQSTH